MPRIVPVIDLKHGVVVRGVAGRRDEYRPIESILAADAKPESIGRAFVDKLRLGEAYLADLDAIAGAAPAWDVYRSLVDCGLSLWIDAGLADVERCRELTDFATLEPRLKGIVAGLESLAGPARLREFLSIAGPERLIFSLDLKQGEPIRGGTGWGMMTAEEILTVALELGARRVIVLDLARVGVGEGVGTEPLCRWLRARDAAIEIIAGGGVRNRGDLASLGQTGCDAALVASALHDGRIQIA